MSVCVPARYPSFLYVAAIKYPDKCREKGLLQLTTPGNSPWWWETPGWRDPEVTSHTHSQQQRENECMHACTQLYNSSTVQDPLPREWCFPEWAGSSHTISILKTDIPTGQHDLDSPPQTHPQAGQLHLDSPSLRLFKGDSRLCQVDKCTMALGKGHYCGDSSPVHLSCFTALTNQYLPTVSDNSGDGKNPDAVLSFTAEKYTGRFI